MRAPAGVPRVGRLTAAAASAQQWRWQGETRWPGFRRSPYNRQISADC